jgi:SAM-dependent methyltransferase
MPNDDFRPDTYWEQRLSANLGLTTVGHAGLGYAYNAWLYRARFRALERALRRAGLGVRGATVAEIGVGSGAYLPFWETHGVGRVTGLDITRVSVDTLAARYPRHTFAQCDIGASLPPGIPLDHDVVTAFDVLFHITDDAAFAAAIGNLARLARPGGHVLLSDSLADTPWGPTRTEFHRTQAHYLTQLARHGVQPVGIEPVFVSMTTTFSGGARLASFTGLINRIVAKANARPVTAWANQLVGASLYAADGLLCRPGARGPSLNLLIARKDGGDAVV